MQDFDFVHQPYLVNPCAFEDHEGVGVKLVLKPLLFLWILRRRLSL